MSTLAPPPHAPPAPDGSDGPGSSAPVLDRDDRGDGGAPARRAVVRWACRLLRRDLRQHILILAMLSVAVAGSVFLATTAFNVAPATGQSEFGDANHFFDIEVSDAGELATKLEAGQAWFGQIDPIGFRPVAVPGLAERIDFRSQQPDGPFGGPMLDLRAGSFPSGDGDVAITDGVARMLQLSIGDILDLDGRARTVVGIVENPSDLGDEFVLVPPSQLAESVMVRMLVDASEDRVSEFRFPNDNTRRVGGRGDLPESVVAVLIVLVVSTVAMVLVALVAAASFVVIAQRRLPQLGLLSAVGATERHVRLTMIATGAATGAVAGVVGVVAGLVAWLTAAPSLDGGFGFRIDPWNVPWWFLGAAIVLSVVTATGAAWWPARTMARIPTVVALSGRPPDPKPVHRSGLLAAVCLAAGIVSLRIGSDLDQSDGVGTGQMLLIFAGVVAVIAGTLLGGPLAIRSVSRIAGRVPIAARLALRDLGRYQARSGAALAAICLSLGIPTAVVASAAAADNGAGAGNLPSTYLLARFTDIDGPFVPLESSLDDLQRGVDEIIAGRDGATAVRLDVANEMDTPLFEDAPGLPAVSLATKIDDGWRDMTLVYVASPEVLDLLDMTADSLEGVDIVTPTASEVGIITERRRSVDGPTIEPTTSTGGLTHEYSALPGALISAERAVERGWEVVPSGRWLLVADSPWSSSDIAAAREVAARHGLTIESRRAPRTLGTLGAGAVAAGVLLAVGVLAMTVGLIRSETAADMRTLAATGSSGWTRRAVTAVTAGALAALAAVLAILGAYAALNAGGIAHLTPLPMAELAVIGLGTPLLGSAVGWLIAGREPLAQIRRPIE